MKKLTPIVASTRFQLTPHQEEKMRVIWERLGEINDMGEVGLVVSQIKIYRDGNGREYSIATVALLEGERAELVVRANGVTKKQIISDRRRARKHARDKHNESGTVSE